MPGSDEAALLTPGEGLLTTPEDLCRPGAARRVATRRACRPHGHGVLDQHLGEALASTPNVRDFAMGGGGDAKIGASGAVRLRRLRYLFVQELRQLFHRRVECPGEIYVEPFGQDQN